MAETKEAAKGAADDPAALKAQIADLEERLAKANSEDEQVAELKAEVDRLKGELASANGKQGPLTKRIEELEGDVKSLTAKLARAEAAKKKLGRKPKSKKIRRFPMHNDQEDPEALLAYRAELYERLQGDMHEIAFCGISEDGGHGEEILSIEPLDVPPSAWRLTGRGVMLTEPVLIRASEGATIGGAALLSKGKPIGFCRLREPVPLVPGRELRLPTLSF